MIVCNSAASVSLEHLLLQLDCSPKMDRAKKLLTKEGAKEVIIGEPSLISMLNADAHC